MPTSQAPLTAPPANATMPFTWGQSTESSTTNRTAAMEYLKDILGTPAGQGKHTPVHDVIGYGGRPFPPANMLQCMQPGAHSYHHQHYLFLCCLLYPPAYIDCASTKTLLSCQLPGTGYSLRGSADIAICTSVAVEANVPATGLHVLFEVKKTKGAL